MIDKNGWKYITVKHLRELLAQCPDNALIGVDEDRDLLVTDLNKKPISYIALGTAANEREK